MDRKTAFVWFHNNSGDARKTVDFYHDLLEWSVSAPPDGSLLMATAAGPFASAASHGPAESGWVPFVQVPDVDTATRRATELGGAVLQPRQSGPMGDFSVVRDPGGATFALWQRGT